ncbi:hypothetical protein [Pseudomonas sp. PD9R]|uniref:hypothetical protein n=1 Tax=Pseudomonas sp. PD9R TaxID=2853534 RepID=UPI001C445372|nr:hypothetical protein [Pseudomonas sp. PD9R]MBV6822023.1 hypothetical protein [Pseudomonas sp. PD9R]
MKIFTRQALVASLLLSGCASSPNAPTLTLQTTKAPADYANCVLPKLQHDALTATVSETQRSYRIVVSSKVAANDVLEAYKANTGGKIFLYERALLASTFGPSPLERAAQECL